MFTLDVILSSPFFHVLSHFYTMHPYTRLLITKQKFKIFNFTSILQILDVIIREVAAVEKKKVCTEITTNGV